MPNGNSWHSHEETRVSGLVCKSLFLECNFIILKHTCRIEIARIGGIVWHNWSNWWRQHAFFLIRSQFMILLWAVPFALVPSICAQLRQSARLWRVHCLTRRCFLRGGCPAPAPSPPHPLLLKLSLIGGAELDTASWPRTRALCQDFCSEM